MDGLTSVSGDGQALDTTPPSPPARLGPVAVIAAIVVAAVAVGGAAAWWLLRDPSGTAYTHPAAKAVDSALETRSRLSTDPADYAPYVESALATELARDSATVAREGSPIPRWERPYVSVLTSVGADVIVVWKRSAEQTSWPVAHKFKTALTGDLWKMTDAEALESSAVPQPMPEE